MAIQHVRCRQANTLRYYSHCVQPVLYLDTWIFSVPNRHCYHAIRVVNISSLQHLIFLKPFFCNSFFTLFATIFNAICTTFFVLFATLCYLQLSYRYLQHLLVLFMIFFCAICNTLYVLFATVFLCYLQHLFVLFATPFNATGNSFLRCLQSFFVLFATLLLLCYSQCWCGDGEVDRHGAGVCDFKCPGDDEYACGGRYSATTYAYTDAAYEPEVVTGATYLGCLKDRADDRVMVKTDTGNHVTAKVCVCVCSSH